MDQPGEIPACLGRLERQIEINKLCAKYQISQAQYYKWRDQFLKFGYKAFKTQNIPKKEQRLLNENKKLKQIVGDLTVEFKKTITNSKT